MEKSGRILISSVIQVFLFIKFVWIKEEDCGFSVWVPVICLCQRIDRAHIVLRMVHLHDGEKKKDYSMVASMHLQKVRIARSVSGHGTVSADGKAANGNTGRRQTDCKVTVCSLFPLTTTTEFGSAIMLHLQVLVILTMKTKFNTSLPMTEYPTMKSGTYK